MTSKAGKRPVRALTAHEKLDAINRVHEGESKASVARDIGVPESTLRGWCKNENKISYLSRQSSPETDESTEHRDKRARIDDSTTQPFNLSVKSAGRSVGRSSYSPNSEPRAAPAELKIENGFAPATPLNLNKKAEVPKTQPQLTEREKNRAELARLSVQLGLNRPEISNGGASTSSIAELTANIGLLHHWNNLMMQQQQQNQSAMNSRRLSPPMHDGINSSMMASAGGLLTTVGSAADMDRYSNVQKSPQEKLENVAHWLKTQHAMLGLLQQPTAAPAHSSSNGTSSASSDRFLNPAHGFYTNSPISDRNSLFWNWYKQNQQVFQQNDQNILYQQLTRDQQNAENLSTTRPPASKSSNNTNRVRSVLDNVLLNNNNTLNVNRRDGKEDEEVMDQSEALEHGEKFLKFLEAYSDPRVTAVHLMQLRTLLNNVKSGANKKKNGAVQNNKAKVRRK